MPTSHALTYGDIVSFLESYPPDAMIFVDHLGEKEWSGGYDIAPNTLGEAMRQWRAAPRDLRPAMFTPHGKGAVIGILFSVAGPVLLLAPVGGPD